MSSTFKRVCFVSREMEGVAGAGGLKDVVRGLADALVEYGVDVTVILPRYGFVEKGQPLYDLNVPLAEKSQHVSVSHLEISGIKIRLLDAPCFSSKSDIYTYTDQDAPDPELPGTGHQDVNEMNLLLQAGAVLSIMQESQKPDIIHGHDGHTGLLALFMKKLAGKSGFFSKTGVLITIHNAGTAYQQILGDIDQSMKLTGFSENELRPVLLDNLVNPLLAAGIYGHVNTVSPGYSRELLSGSDSYSGSLGPAFRERNINVKGIYNGLNPDLWIRRPEVKTIDINVKKSLLRKRLTDLLNEEGFPEVKKIGGSLDPKVPWILFHGRLTAQKGLNAILDLPEDLDSPGLPFKFLVYGRGEAHIERQIIDRTEDSNRWIFLNGYNHELTGQLIAASSFVVIPSLWEPCGQIDMIGQALGALPIVRSVGGLSKVRHRYDGFKYSSKDPSGLVRNLKLALKWEWKRQRWVSLMRRRAENVIYGRRIWRKILVQGYIPLYRKAQRDIRHRA
jgi:starch synthase